MGKESYDLQTIAGDNIFEFTSIGTKGSIRKRIVFEKMKTNIYQLSFGDIDSETGLIDVSVISDNGDRDKILSTIAKSIHLFFVSYPDSAIYFVGSNEARTRLYRMVINKYLEFFSTGYKILGVENGEIEIFQRNRHYEAFAVVRSS